MTVQEFSNEFDTLSAAHLQTGGPDILAFDEYEKSVYLTKAQESVALGLYGGSALANVSFEDTEKTRRFLDPLIKTVKPDLVSNYSGELLKATDKVYKLPEDVWFITFEQANITTSSSCSAYSTIEIIPIKQDEFHRIKWNPFKTSNNRRAFRLDLGVDSNSPTRQLVEIYSKNTISDYTIRYIKKLEPIILVNLSGDNVSINGKTTASTGSFTDDVIHRNILEEAVRAALVSKGVQLKSNQ